MCTVHLVICLADGELFRNSRMRGEREGRRDRKVRRDVVKIEKDK